MVCIYLYVCHEAVERGTPKKEGTEAWGGGWDPVVREGVCRAHRVGGFRERGTPKEGGGWAGCYGGEGCKEGGWMHVAFYRWMHAVGEWVSISRGGNDGKGQEGREGSAIYPPQASA